MATYRVTSPYVTLPILDSASGKAQVHGFYAGAIVTDPVAGDVLTKHVDSGMVEKVTAAKAAPAPGLEGDDEPKVPAKSAAKPEWVAYAVSQGMSEEDAEKASKDDLIAALGS